MTLRWSLVSKGMRPHDQIRQKIQQKVRKLEQHLEHFPSDAVHLQIALGKSPKKPVFDARLTLRLPSNILHAEKSAADPVPALDQAIKALLREIALLKSALRREKEWGRARRFPDLATISGPISPRLSFQA